MRHKHNNKKKMDCCDHNHEGHDNHNHQDHSNHHEMMARDFKKRFFIALIVSIPVLVLSPSIQEWFGFSIPDFTGLKFVLFGLASVIALYAAWPFYTHAKKEISSGQWGMMTLVSLAVLSGYLYSVATTFFIAAAGFYWEISTLVMVLLLGHWLEMRAVVKTGGALKELAKLIPPRANKVGNDGEIEEVETSRLQIGDRVLVKPGGKVPIDGEVIKGKSEVSEAMITGESKPVPKEEGDEVIGGTINESGSIIVKVIKTGEDTALSQIMKLVKETQESKPKTQRLADKAAHWLTIIAIVVGLGTFVVWGFIIAKGFLFALTLAITVVVITCPHALGLAIPTVTTITTTKAAKNGILIRSMDGLERARSIDYIVFDKTGTLTKGEFGVTDVVATDNSSEEEVLKLAASLDQNSEHVIAKAIVSESKKRKIQLEEASEYRSLPGKGGKGKVSGKDVYIGNNKVLKETKADNFLSKEAEKLMKESKTLVYVISENSLKGIIALADVIRPESKEVIEKLHSMGYKIAMLTGDTREVAVSVASELKIDTFFAEVLPEDKVEKVRELQGSGDKVMMVGDGINDAPALIQADVGVAIGAGTDVAMHSAEIVLVKNNPLDIVKLINLSHATMKKMHQNLWWATGYNIVAIPLAAGVLYNYGIILRPEWAALLMTASSIIVVFNALLLKKVKLK